MKKLKQPIFYLQLILIAFSIAAFLFSCWKAFSMYWDFSPGGFETFLNVFQPYSMLYAATFVVISTQLAIERLGLMSEANFNSFKIGNRTAWSLAAREFISETKNSDPYLAKDITRQLLDIHDFLFENNYKLNSIDEAKSFFVKFFANKVAFYEEMNEEHMELACYENENKAYSWDAFRYLIQVMVNTDQSYPRFITDLQQLYLAEVKKMPNRLIDSQTYQLVVQDRSKRRREEKLKAQK